MTLDPSLLVFKTQPFDHQRREIEETALRPRWAHFWDQGTGKTHIGINTLAINYRLERLRGLIVVAPPGVERNWVTDELPAHMPDDIPYRAFTFESGSSSTKWHKKEVADLLKCQRQVPILALSYYAWKTEAGKRAAWDIMRSRPTALYLDEAHWAKSWSADWTSSLQKAGQYSPLVRLFTGTPIDLPFDVYSQVAILDPGFWQRELGFSTFTDFKAFFGIFRRETRRDDRTYPVLVAYQNLSILRELLKKLSSRVMKDDVLDLPQKLYTRRYYEMHPAQREVYERLENEFSAQFPGEPEDWITAELPIVRMMRLQQVLCGYVPVDGEDEPRELIDPKKNPRLDATHTFVEEAGNRQVVVSAVFRKDIDLVMERLTDVGRKPVRYDGAANDAERARAKEGFKAGDFSDLVINPSVGAEGLTFVNCATMAFHSNNYRIIKRKQTEDRIHRIGQVSSVLYGDLICPGTRDEKVIRAFQKKARLSAEILGDAPKEWL